MISFGKKIYDRVSDALDINPATLSGCIDIIVVEQQDGSLQSSPFHVRFGKLKVLKTKKKLVKITINGHVMPFRMKLGSAGEAYFDDGSKNDEESFLSDDPDGFLSSDGELEKLPTKPDSPKEGNANKEESKKEKESKGWFPWRKETEEERKEREEREKKEKEERDKEEKRKKDEKEKKQREKQEKKDKEEREKREKKEKEEREKKEKEERERLEKEEKERKEKERKEEEEKKKKEKTQKLSESDKKKADQDGSTADGETEDEKRGIIGSFLGMFMGGDKKKEKDPYQNSAEKKSRESSAHNSPKEDKQFLNEAESFYEGLGNFELNLEGDEDLSSKSKPKKKENKKEGEKEKLKVVKESKDSKEKEKEIQNDLKSSNQSSPNKTVEVRDTPNPALILESRSDTFKSNPEENQMPQETQEDEPDIELSLCGSLLSGDDPSINDVFAKNRISFEKFIQDPISIISNPDLMVRIEDNLYDWRVACPLIVALLAFKKPIPEDVLERMITKHISKSSWRDWFSTSKKKETIIKPKKLTSPSIDPIQPVSEVSKLDLDAPSSSLEIQTQKVQEESEKIMESINYPIKEEDIKKESAFLDIPNISVTKVASDAESVTSEGSVRKYRKNKKTLRPTSAQLKAMKLKIGANEVIYTVNNESVNGWIYYWPPNSKIVISDVDGTITKSDVLGHLFNMVGKDWSHPGITNLYSSIVKNGYQILYLTARAIGQSETTRNYLTGLQQDGLRLPPGPIIMSPDRLIYSFKREVIYKRPEVFKIACLREIKSLFPVEHNVFYAGFGNRETVIKDAIAYTAVGVPSGKIFIINPQGEISQYNNTYKKSYFLLNGMYDEMFPAIDKEDKYQADEQFNSVNYFKINYENMVDLSDLL